LGHLVEDCRAFKFKVQDLINAKRIDFRETRPNIIGNPLPNHENQEVNAIEARDDVAIIDKVEDVKMPMGFIFREICRQGLVEVITSETHSNETESCEMHGCVGHSLEDCQDFRALLQKMMDLKLIAIGGCSPCPEINVIKKGQEETHMESVITSEGSPFPYESDKAVPWIYKEEPTMNPSMVTNIARSSRITRTGHIYVPPEVERGPSGIAKGKEKVLEHIEEDIEVALPEGISNDEACEFLKFIKQSEYRVVDQLNKTPARISLLSLLMSSEAHRNVLLKVLNQAHVSHDITTDKLGGIVNNIVADNYTSFRDEEIPAEGTNHVRALHISVMYNDCVIGKVLLDNGSSLNVMTKRTFSRLPVDTSYLKASSMIVKGFDGSRREVMGEMDLPIKIGPCTFNILFHVMDINPTYSCLLGRPWIHSSGAIPSTLHQKVKFIVDGRLITVSGEEDVMVSQPVDTRYIEVTEEALEPSFQGLEIANSTVMIEGAPLIKPYPSDFSLRMAKVMIRGGYQPGSGLGKYGKEIIIPKANKGRYGLGYRPTKEDMLQIIEARKGEHLAWLGQFGLGNMVKIPIPHISQCFVSGGTGLSGMVAIVEEEGREEEAEFEYWCPPSTCLRNWLEESYASITLESKFDSDSETEGHASAPLPGPDQPVHQVENDSDDEEREASPELLRLVEQEAKEIQPHQEPVELVNLGSEEDKKEVRACKARRIKPEISLRVKEEVEKWLIAGFVKVAEYPDWVAKVVAVPKKGGNLRICVDYRDLNKASPKDDFPVPHIDVLVDSTADHALFSFRDGYSGYHQIKMVP
ncbi:PREDICTED: uncharacterized protein LOC109337570, partial [Lupinus angustifolius]|uniref:uncharacterized protein LOC109337570 n=1 Tax=Lupinus angustifolius TaxID=3871 RepID=UPI00092F1851